LVNLRLGDARGPRPGSVAEPLETLADLQRQGLIRHLGVSNATADQVAEARTIVPIVCVQNMYNLAFRHDDELIDDLAEQGIAYVPFFPLGGFNSLQASRSRRWPTGRARPPWPSLWPGCCVARRTSC
jgi:aryl-alcohol dehydrogenase-like predicted oxidoreductase